MGKTGLQRVLLHVQGMACTGCERRIGKVLTRLDGVREVGADHRIGEVRVLFCPEQVAPGALAEKIEQAGYRVTGSEAVS